jgi:hypothetical protein
LEAGGKQEPCQKAERLEKSGVAKIFGGIFGGIF